jgi:hypothetical protein
LDKGLLQEGYFFLVVSIEPAQQASQFGTDAGKRIAIGWQDVLELVNDMAGFLTKLIVFLPQSVYFYCVFALDRP